MATEDSLQIQQANVERSPQENAVQEFLHAAALGGNERQVALAGFWNMVSQSGQNGEIIEFQSVPSVPPLNPYSMRVVSIGEGGESMICFANEYREVKFSTDILLISLFACVVRATAPMTHRESLSYGVINTVDIEGKLCVITLSHNEAVALAQSCLNALPQDQKRQMYDALCLYAPDLHIQPFRNHPFLRTDELIGEE